MACKFGQSAQLVDVLIDYGADLGKLDSEQKSALHHACQNGTEEMLERLIEKSKKILTKLQFQEWICAVMKKHTVCTPLHVATQFRNIAAMKTLLENGANPNAPSRFSHMISTNSHDPDHTTPLHWAAKYGYDDAIELLVQYGAVINGEDLHHSCLPIHLAAAYANVDIVKLLIDKYQADPVGKGQAGRHAIHWACLTGNLENVKYFITELKADPAEKDRRNGDNCLHYACNGNHADLIEYLMNVRNDVGFVAAKNRNDLTPFHVLCSKGNRRDILDGLCESTFNAYIREWKVHEARRGLCIAAEYNNLAAMQVILDKNVVNADVAEPDTRSTALHLACKNGFSEGIELLMRKGARADRPDSEHKTPFHYAVESEINDNVKLLMEAGGAKHVDSFLNAAFVEKHFEVINNFFDVAIEYLDPLKFDYFHLLCQHNCHKIVEKLGLKYRKSVEEILKERIQYPLYTAVDKNQPELLKILLKHMTWDEVGPDGLSPLLLAVIKEYHDIVNIFLEPHSGHKRRVANMLLRLCEYGLIKDEESQEWKITTLVDEDNQISDWLRNLAAKYPRFNEHVEQRGGGLVPMVVADKIPAENFEATILDLCPMKMMNSTENTFYVLSEDCKVQRMCEFTCKIREECEKVRAMLELCKNLGLSLQKDDKYPLWKSLRPEFILIGSVAEGTRIGKASEIDIAVQFKALNDRPFHVEDDPYHLIADSDESHPLKEFLNDGSKLDYNRVFERYLDEIGECFKTGLKLPRNITLGSMMANCEECKTLFPKHCIDCLPCVTHTKSGACLIVKWKNAEILTIDLIPVWPVRTENVMQMFNVVTRSLAAEKPVNWLPYLKKLIRKDRVLLEHIMTGINPGSSDLYTGMKMLNDSDSQFVLRPAQSLRLEQFKAEPRKKRIYQLLKAVKQHLDIDVGSYFLKKSVLNAVYASHIGASGDLKDLAKHLLEILSSNEDLKAVYLEKIDVGRDYLIGREGLIPLKGKRRIPRTLAQSHDRLYNRFI